MQSKEISFVFFGSSDFSVFVLDELKKSGLLPSLIVATPDTPKGRGLKLSAPPTKTWAMENKIEVYQPEKLDDFSSYKLQAISYKLFIVASYGFIIPKNILGLPERGTLNVHPSLLPKYRGSSPIQSQILNDEKEAGITIIGLDEKMDHGPIVAQEKIAISEPARADELEKTLAIAGGKLLAKIIPDWIAGKITPEEQDHSKATFTKKITKEDGLLDLAADPYKNFLKFQAFYGWPGTYFFAERQGKKIRVAIKSAKFENGTFRISRVIPEGKKEMDYEAFLRGLK